MRPFLVLLSAAATVITPGCTASAPGGTGEPRAIADGRLMTPERIVDHVWYKRQPPRIWTAVIGNVGIIEQTDGVVLIDSGGSISDGRDLVAEVAKLTSKPIKAVVITHLHNDHSLGVAGVVERYPHVRVIATQTTADLLAKIVSKNTGLGRNDPVLDRKLLEAAEKRASEDAVKAKDPSLAPDQREGWAIDAAFAVTRAKRKQGNFIVMPTETFNDRLVLDDSHSPVELYFLGRAHSPGDLIAWMPKERILFTGDIVVSPSPYGYNSSNDSWMKVLQRLKQYDFKVLVPGHGAVQRDKSYLDTMIWSLADVKRQVARSVAAGKTAAQTRASLDERAQIARFHATTPWARQWLDSYWLDQLVTCTYQEITTGKVDYPG